MERGDRSSFGSGFHFSQPSLKGGAWASKRAIACWPSARIASATCRVMSPVETAAASSSSSFQRQLVRFRIRSTRHRSSVSVQSPRQAESGRRIKSAEFVSCARRQIQNEPTGAVLDDRHRPCDSNLLAPDAPHHDVVSGLPPVFDCHRCTLPECDSALFFNLGSCSANRKAR